MKHPQKPGVLRHPRALSAVAEMILNFRLYAIHRRNYLVFRSIALKTSHFANTIRFVSGVLFFLKSEVNSIYIFKSQQQKTEGNAYSNAD